MEAECEQQVCGGDEAGGAEEAMLWSIKEAVERQTLQIGVSACGATAVVDVLKALSMAVVPDEADRCVQTRLRRNESPLPDYLLSRSEAGNCFSNSIERVLHFKFDIRKSEMCSPIKGVLSALNHEKPQNSRYEFFPHSKWCIVWN